MTLCGSLGLRCGCGLRGETAPDTGLLAGTYPTLQTSGSGETTEPYDVKLDPAWPNAFNTRVAAWVNSTTQTATPWNDNPPAGISMTQAGNPVTFTAAYSKWTRYGILNSDALAVWNFVFSVTVAAAAGGELRMGIPTKAGSGINLYGLTQIYLASTGVRTLCSSIGTSAGALQVNFTSNAGLWTTLLPAGSAIRGCIRFEV